jgi:hypothetical protein
VDIPSDDSAIGVTSKVVSIDLAKPHLGFYFSDVELEDPERGARQLEVSAQQSVLISLDP